MQISDLRREPMPRHGAGARASAVRVAAMSVLVTGGAGYIGAHVVRLLVAAGQDVVVVDDLSTGDAARVADVEVLRADVASAQGARLLAEVMRDRSVDDVIHLAARKRVDESLERPLWYAEQNITGVHNVLAAMETADVRSIVFSSSAAVYGDTAVGSAGSSGGAPIVEDAPTEPVNPYGRSKLVGEWLVRDAVRARPGLRGVALRYFNVAGSGWDDLGDPEVLNLVTIVLAGLERGERPRVFGTDYPTPDGTCVRDFVHVQDLARAHVAALRYLGAPGAPAFDVLNVGTGTGASVLEVVGRLVSLTGSDVRPELEGRRAGDPANVVAAVDKIERLTGWRAELDLDQILTSALSARRQTPVESA